ncbi:C3a anaphylatoxin chemotactic receptor [Marmota flaviventris]|uniref:C3a anaphylatoxin chemotactic receptor n=1 Tax=Marmota flaviventris TaxID=93162 RepID=UPI000FFF94E4|nr:C3a anaphylatoxin chemotactic receptor [Marmota flaviventris]XP_027806354.1 C3a anaphylatoxin chemotactic receptor [Marmota flaviventris]XP_027806355.1 C3a anaphylatoxin chemotactic receptor [Marmota flaviventris]
MESFSAETNSTDPLSQPLYEPQIILSMVILGLTFLLGLPGNGLVLWVAGLKMQRTVNTVWFLHLTLADFLCCLSLPFSLAHLALHGYWPYGRFLCKLIPSIIILNMSASVFLLTAISVDRCLMVLKPIWCQNHRRVRTAFAICGCIWMMSFAMCIPVFMHRETFTVDDYKMCIYNFDLTGSDYSDYTYDPDELENGSFTNSIVQQPGKMDDKLNSSSFQANNYPWTAPTILQSQTLRRHSGDLIPGESARLSSQHPSYNNFKPPNISSASPSGFLTEDHKTDVLHSPNNFLPTDLDLYPRAYSDNLYEPEESQDFQDYNLSQFPGDSQVQKTMMIITITRLVLGFLLPFIIIVCCYSIIVFRMRRSQLTKSRNKTFRVTVMVVTVFLVCWTPYHIIGVLLLVINPGSSLRGTLLSWDNVALALASANSCFNPFLYALLGKDFRKKAKQSVKGILEAAFSEELTHSTSCFQNKVFTERNSISTGV